MYTSSRIPSPLRNFQIMLKKQTRLNTTTHGIRQREESLLYSGKDVVKSSIYKYACIVSNSVSYNEKLTFIIMTASKYSAKTSRQKYICYVYILHYQRLSTIRT